MNFPLNMVILSYLYPTSWIC